MCTCVIAIVNMCYFTGSVAVAVDEKRTSLMEFGRYVQEMLPKYVQQAQISHG